MVGPTMNLISGTHHSCEIGEYVFMVLQKYIIISPNNWSLFNDLKSLIKWLKGRVNESELYIHHVHKKNA